MRKRSFKITIPVAAALAAMLLANAYGQTTLVAEDWQSPMYSNGTQNPSFAGWNIISGTGAYSRTSGHPGDSAVTPPNQGIELNQTSAHPEYDISHNWAATDVYYLRVEVSPNSWGGQNQRYVRPELHQQDGTVLWSTAEDSTTAVPLYDNFASLTDYPSELTFFFTIDASTFTTGTAGQPIRLRLDHSGQRSLYFNNVNLTLGPLPADNTAPADDTPTWEVVPTVSDFTTISMKADSVRDPGDLYGVEYYFENTAAATNSGWQDARTWSESGLAYNTLYTYRVKARDKSPNQNESTTWSSAESATTDPQDLTLPSPDPVTWDVVPEVGDYGCITMTVNAASDISGVEYYFENTVAVTNSGWQDGTTWNEGGLDHDTLYTYRAKARDKSPDQNESTTWSSAESATTPSVPAGTLVITKFQCPLLPNNTGNPDFAGWTLFNGGSVKARRQGSDGMPGDITVSPNQGVQFEWDSAEMQYDTTHTWAATDVYTLTINVAPQNWNIQAQRYIRPTLRQTNGIVLWDPGENLTAPNKTALPTGVFSGENLFGNSIWQAEPTLNFTFTVNASTFTAGTEGQPIALRLDSSGQRGTYVDNVTLSVSQAVAGVPDIIDVTVLGNGDVLLTLDGSESGLTAQQSDDLTASSFSDVASTPGTNTLTIAAGDVDPNADGADYFRVRN
jgi:hypothetical protein